jgi:hypothetical protein
MKRRCAACREWFTPSVRVPGQRYCGEERCQRARRRVWQKKKRRGDPDYRENEQRAQQARSEKHPEYWKQYRQKNPEYTQKNRKRQMERDAKRRGTGRKQGVKRGERRVLANEDASRATLPIKSGTYELKMAGADVLANGDAIRVEISVLSAT